MPRTSAQRDTTRKPKIGRPTKYTPELGEVIIERLSRESITAVFSDPALPERQTYYNWLLAHPAFFDASARARSIAALRELDDAERQLIDASSDAKAGKAINVSLLRERLQHSRWKVSKLLPRTYGDRIEISGPEGGAIPVRVTDAEEAREALRALGVKA